MYAVKALCPLFTESPRSQAQRGADRLVRAAHLCPQGGRLRVQFAHRENLPIGFLRANVCKAAAYLPLLAEKQSRQ